MNECALCEGRGIIRDPILLINHTCPRCDGRGYTPMQDPSHSEPKERENERKSSSR